MRGETLPGRERHPSRRLLDDQAQNYVQRLFYGAALVAPSYSHISCAMTTYTKSYFGTPVERGPGEGDRAELRGRDRRGR
jgi:hypothetical protein